MHEHELREPGENHYYRNGADAKIVACEYLICAFAGLPHRLGSTCLRAWTHQRQGTKQTNVVVWPGRPGAASGSGPRPSRGLPHSSSSQPSAFAAPRYAPSNPEGAIAMLDMSGQHADAQYLCQIKTI